MIVYSVTVNIEDDVHQDWLSWMKDVHIPDVMNTGIFSKHEFNRVIQHNPEETGTTYNIQYTCKSMKDLHHYQANFAPKLQAEHHQKYEGKYVAFRTLLERVEA